MCTATASQSLILLCIPSEPLYNFSCLTILLSLVVGPEFPHMSLEAAIQIKEGQRAYICNLASALFLLNYILLEVDLGMELGGAKSPQAVQTPPALYSTLMLACVLIW